MWRSWQRASFGTTRPEVRVLSPRLRISKDRCKSIDCSGFFVSGINCGIKSGGLNLEKYEELLKDNEKFEKYIESITNRDDRKSRRFKIPEGLENIFSEPYSPPNEELVRNEIKLLMEEYYKFDYLSDYAEKLLHYILIIDLDMIAEHLDKFPILIEEISNLKSNENQSG